MMIRKYIYGFNRIAAIALIIVSGNRADAEKLSFYGREAATVGVYITDITTGQAVEEENIGMSMIPASILKSVTAATALNVLSDNFRYKTDVMLQGDVEGGKLKGNLVIKASGDPTIESSHFTNRTGFMDMIVKALKSRDISFIDGQIIIDEERFSDTGQIPQWVIEDTGWDYGAGFYGFNYSDNTFRLYTEDGRTVPEVPYIDVIVDKNSSGTDIERGVNSNLYIVSGRNVDRKNFSVTTTMNSPSETFIFNLSDRLQKENISVAENDIGSTGCETLLLSYESPTNGEMLRTMMFKSDNMMAEAILRALAPGQSRDNVIKKELEYWNARGVSTSFIKIADGSGLARVDRVTPKFMTDILAYMAKSPLSDTYVSLFPRVGREGTVKNLLANTALEGRLVLKSGSMNGVHCYAGYKIDGNGKPTHTIVIIVNNFYCSRDALRKEIQRFLLSVFK